MATAAGIPQTHFIMLAPDKIFMVKVGTIDAVVFVKPRLLSKKCLSLSNSLFRYFLVTLLFTRRTLPVFLHQTAREIMTEK